MSNDLASRSINSVKWNSISNIFQLVLGVIQTVILARLLPIETFGVYAGAAAIVQVTACVASFGMASAFLYRTKETEDIEKTAKVHFTLQLIFSTAWAAIMLTGGFVFIKPIGDGFLTAFVIIVISQTIFNTTATPRVMIARTVQYKRIAFIIVIDTIITFIVSLTLAFLQKPILALVATNVINAFTHVVMLYFWKPVFRPKFAWDKQIVSYFIHFGAQQVAARFLMEALDRFDELWIKFNIGTVALGLYSKAYSFAQYPSKIVAAPVTNVSNATYAEVAGNKSKLSEAFTQTNSLLLYSGFFIVGGFILIAPEFVRVVLGEKWVPMLLALQIMLPYAMLEPVKQTMANIFVSVGKPGMVVKIRSLQLAIMIAGLFILGNLYGKEGVAVTVDITAVVGIILVLVNVKKYVTYSLRNMFVFPGAALVMGILAGYAVDHYLLAGISDIFSALIKGTVFSVLYLFVLYILSREELKLMFQLAKTHLFHEKF